MSVLPCYSTTFRYLNVPGVTDVQTIIDTLYAELVTNGGWTCTVGGIGLTPTEFRSPARADGAFFTVNLTRTSATRLSWVIRDQYGIQVNNQTSTKQDIDAGGTAIDCFTGPMHVCVNSLRTTQETMHCGMAEQSHEGSDSIPYAVIWAHKGPRNDAGTLAADRYWGNVFLRLNGGTTYYGSSTNSIMRGRLTTARTRSQTVAGTWQFFPLEFLDYSNYTWMGRATQCVVVDQSQFPAGAEITAPLGGAVTGVFKVDGCLATSGLRTAWRKG
jgi:hypothetical protein